MFNVCHIRASQSFEDQTLFFKDLEIISLHRKSFLVTVFRVGFLY